VTPFLSLRQALLSGVYRITFDTGAYYARVGGQSFYPEVAIVFEVNGRSVEVEDRDRPWNVNTAPHGMHT
jgi:5-hydroxyisourate hydrolase-like protein (transthyretin family)